MRKSPFPVMVMLGRVALAGGIFAFIGAWITELTDAPLFGLSQQHLFSDAVVLVLIGIAFLIDAYIHAIEEEN